MSENTATQTEPTTPGTHQPPFVGTPPRRLTRVRDGKMLAGVSTGLARYLGVDPVVVRVGFALTTLFGGAGVLAYIACWVLMPNE
jgi:phage shock protein PspC (stress-responsive transcriptional regulator)